MKLKYRKKKNGDLEAFHGKKYVGLICLHHKDQFVVVCDWGDHHRSFPTLEEAKDDMARWRKYTLARRKFEKNYVY